MSDVSCAKRIQDIEFAYREKFGLNNSDRKMNTLSNVLSLALVIIGSLALCGVMKNPTLGWTTLGIGAATMMLQVCGGNWGKRKVDLISWTVIASGLMVVGALGGSGMLSTCQVGYCTLSILSASLLFYWIILRSVAWKLHQDKSLNP